MTQSPIFDPVETAILFATRADRKLRKTLFRSMSLATSRSQSITLETVILAILQVVPRDLLRLVEDSRPVLLLTRNRDEVPVAKKGIEEILGRPLRWGEAEGVSVEIDDEVSRILRASIRVASLHARRKASVRDFLAALALDRDAVRNLETMGLRIRSLS